MQFRNARSTRWDLQRIIFLLHFGLSQDHGHKERVGYATSIFELKRVVLILLIVMMIEWRCRTHGTVTPQSHVF